MIAFLLLFVLGVDQPPADGLKAQPTGLLMTWDSLAGVDGFNIYRDGVRIATVGSTATSYKDTNVTPGRTYSYWSTSVLNGVESNPTATWKCNWTQPPKFSSCVKQ